MIEPPPLPLELSDVVEPVPGKVVTCPVEDCGAWAWYPDVPDCVCRPCKCDACDAILDGFRHLDELPDEEDVLVWMGDAGWLCRLCRTTCEECGAEGVITFCGVCATCLRVVLPGGLQIWPPQPVVQLWLAEELDAPGGKALRWGAWERLDQ